MERRFIISHTPTRDNYLLISSQDVEMSSESELSSALKRVVSSA